MKREKKPRIISMIVECKFGHQSDLDGQFSMSSYGGCSGGHYDGDYCYCDPAVTEFDFTCNKCDPLVAHNNVKLNV